MRPTANALFASIASIAGSTVTASTFAMLRPTSSLASALRPAVRYAVESSNRLRTSLKVAFDCAVAATAR